MNKTPIKITHVIIALTLIIVGVVGAVTPYSFNWLSTTFFGSASLLIIFGYRQFKSMMKPKMQQFALLSFTQMMFLAGNWLALLPFIWEIMMMRKNIFYMPYLLTEKIPSY